MAGHLRRGSTLVEKNQLLDIQFRYGLSSRLTAAPRLVAILLLRVERFFLSGSPSCPQGQPHPPHTQAHLLGLFQLLT